MTASNDERKDIVDVHEREPDEQRQLAAEVEHDPRPADGTAPAGDTAETTGSKQAKPRKKNSFWIELPILVVIALVLTFLIQTFVARVYEIPSGSMEHTLHGCLGCTPDRILVDKLSYDFTDPKPGDVVVFKGPPGWDQAEFPVQESSNVVVRWLRQFGSSIGIGSSPEFDLVKRIIATGGQTISCCDAQNRIIVNGKPLDEPYVSWMPGTGPANQKRFAPVTVPKGYLFMMGDNRNNSADSRYQNGGGLNGVVPVGDVIGIARTIIWPPGRWSGIGETDVQTMALSAPAWQQGLPLGIGCVGAWPTLWLGRRLRNGRSMRSHSRRIYRR